MLRGLDGPSSEYSVPVRRGWKWEVLGDLAVHGREIYDAKNDEFLAWAFCVVRDGFLDVDEFFVWPDERRKGYGRELANMVLELAAQLKKPIRQIVSFADTEQASRDGAEAVAGMLNVRLSEADVRWASMIGTTDVQPTSTRDWKPARPASLLEFLRPRVEPPVTEPRQYSVFFGTNRKPKNASNASDGFLNERGDQLSLGTCLVEIPKSHIFGSVGRSWLRICKRADSDQRRIVYTEALDEKNFIAFSSSLANKHGEDCRKYGNTPQNLLFVHGYRNSFEDAVLCAAQLGFDLKIPGCTFLFSWPSGASLEKYAADEATIETSIPCLKQYIDLLLGEFPNIPLNIIAHSMGNRAVLRLFESLASDENIPGILGQLIFAAPDVDAELFQQKVTTFSHLPRRMSTYVSRADAAIQASKFLHGYHRVGLAPPVTVTPGVDTILVEGFNLFDFLGHNYFAEAEAVLHDMFNLIRYGSPPEDRPRLEASHEQTDLPFWCLRMS